MSLFEGNFSVASLGYLFNMDAIEKLGHSFACVCVISLFEVISLLHPWVTCLSGCNRKTGAFICLFCDYFAIKFKVSFKK